MAKKKKPAANPARGFATTSIASKPKPEAISEKETPEVQELKNDVAQNGISTPKQVVVEHAKITEKYLHELTPEELTEQLERNELQLVVENYGPKVRREVARLDSKLRADTRVLRSQAMDVSLRKWLPDELMAEIMDTIRKEHHDDTKMPAPPPTIKASEEDLLFRCWTLWEALLKFGILLVHVKKAIRAVIEKSPCSDAGAYIWGFREAIELLAIELEEDDLPHFDTRKSRSAMQSAIDSNNNSVFNTPTESTQTSRDPSPRRMNGRQNGASHDAVATDDSEDVNAEDFDSDAEPDDLATHYLLIKERLYRHRADLIDVPATKGKKSKSARPPAPLALPTKPNEKRLITLMKNIESDMLFDKHEAESRWSLRRIQIMQEASMARATPNADNASDPPPQRSEKIHDTQKPADEVLTSSSSPENSTVEDDVLLGGMFIAPDEEAIVDTGLLDQESANGAVTLRDMGKLAGLSARRVLEDACKGRDSRARITFTIISKTTYVSRHNVTITWSTEQDRIAAKAVPYLQLDQRSSSKDPEAVSAVSISMTEVATPDAKQSEAFIATAALFYIMSTSQKEEKQYLKLQPNFRDLYLELAAYEKECADASDREVVKEIRSMVHEYNQQQEDDGVVLSAAFRNRGVNSPRPGSSRGASPSRAMAKAALVDLMDMWNGVHASPRFQQMLPVRMSLPMFGFKQAALSAIDSSQVIILCGETGCGKSTQLPSYVLEHELSQGKSCKIYCTQPRRISAISLAQRVSEELGEKPGDVGSIRSLVGYAIRLESKMSARTRLVYATVGVVLRMLESSRTLDDITHLIIDEVHERSIDTDFLLIVLRALMVRRPELKVVLMSATVDATRFSKYLDNAPIIQVPGRTFPVQTRYLEDAIELTGFTTDDTKAQQQDEDDIEGTLEGGSSGISNQLTGYSAATRNTLAQYDEYKIDFELIVRLMEQIATDPMYADFSKATLVFLPGIAEIRQLHDRLTSSPVFQHNCWVIPLHSTIASEDQQMAFKIPAAGVRKVVLATNIAETGITIPDVTCVIDTGKHKEMRYDERKQMSRLIQSFISRANAKQRRGRAGRVQEGLCFHLFTKHRHDEMMAEQQTPEMLRLSLQDLVMRVKICGLGQIEDTLAQALDPPLAKNVRRAIDSLIEVGALTQSENLTTLGSQLAKLPLDANLGKLCLMSAIFGCLDAGLTIAATLSFKSPFITPFGDRQRADNARLSFARGNSDLLTDYNAYTTWRKVSQAPGQSVFSWCRKNYLSHQNLTNIEDLKGHLLSSLAETGLVLLSKNDASRSYRGRQQGFVEIPTALDGNSDNDVVVSSVLAWSLYPKLLIRDGKGYRNIANSQQVSLHPTSVNKGNRDLKFLSYYSMMASAGGAKFYNALSTSAVSDLPLLLLAGDAEWKLHAGVMVIDGNRLRFRVGTWKDAAILKALRSSLRNMVESRLKEPRKEVSTKSRAWIEAWEKMCSSFEERSKKL